jgi:uncharacterized membrane protein YkoI
MFFRAIQCVAAIVAVTVVLVTAVAEHAAAADEDDTFTSVTTSGDSTGDEPNGRGTGNPKTPTPPTAASNNGRQSESSRSEQEDARIAGRKGLVLPYGQVLKKVRQIVPGDVVRVRLNRKTLNWTYDVTVLDTDGRYTLLSLNARTGRVLSRKKK